MAEKVGSVYIEIQAKMGSLEADLKRLEEKMKQTDNSGISLSEQFRRIEQSAKLFGDKTVELTSKNKALRVKMEELIAKGIDPADKGFAKLKTQYDANEKELSKLKTTTDKSTTSFISMGKMIAGAAITGAVIGLGKACLTAASQMEQNKVAFTTMLGSAEKADQLLKKMTAFAASTPFELPEIVDAGKKLLAFGFSAESIVPTLTKLGDISAALNIPVGELSDLYGKARTQGTLFAEDLNQLAGRGIPVFTELAKVMGASADKVKKLGSEGKISFKELEQAFTNMTKQGSQFGGLMAAQSQTLGGQWSNFNDALDQTAVLFGDTILKNAKSTLTVLTSIVQTYSEWLKTNTDIANTQENYIKLTDMASAGLTDVNEKLTAIYNQGGKNAEYAALYAQYLQGHVKLSAEQITQIEKMIGLNRSLSDINYVTNQNELESWKQRGMILDKVVSSQGQSKKSAEGSAAAWKKMADEAKKFSENIAKQADETDDPVVKVEKELAAIENGYNENKKFKQKGLIDTSQYNLNVINLTEARIKKEEELEKAKFDKIAGMYSTMASAATNISGQLASLSSMYASNKTAEIDNELQQQQDAIQAKYDADVAAANNSVMTETEKTAKLKALDEQKARDEAAVEAKAEKEKRKIAREAAKQQKALSVFDTLITIPQAAFGAFNAAQDLPFPANMIVGAASAATVTALGLAKLKLIQDQPLPALAMGGIVPAVPGGNQFTLGEAGSAEAVIPLNDSTLSRLAGMINSAGGSGQAIQVTVNLDGTVIYSDLYKATKDGRAMISQRAVVA